MSISFRVLLWAAFSIVVVACSNEDLSMLRNPTKSDVSNTEETVQKMLIDYHNSISADSRSSELPQLTICERVTYQILEDSLKIVKASSRSEIKDSVFDIVTAKFKIGETQGYSILSDDEHINRVLFYTENGVPGDTIGMHALSQLLKVLPKAAANIYKSGGASSRSTPYYIVHPIVSKKWGQGQPFNNFAKVCHCSDCNSIGGHTPIGCVATATAQTIATTKKFKGTFYGNQNIDFDNLPAYNYLMNQQQQLQIAHFFHEVALCCQIKFECGGSGSTLKAAYHYLKDMGYSCEYHQGCINTAKLITELSNGYPHLIAGGHHAWIVDGIRVADGNYDFSCNWGWGGYQDGWSIGDPFTTQDNDEYCSNLRHIYINSTF